MEQQQTQRGILDGLVAAGRLSEQEAGEIAHAPEWSLTVRELVSYLAALIMLVGVMRLVVAAFEDASQETIGTALALAGAALAAVSWRLPRRTDVWVRLAEVVEGAAVVSLSASLGVFLDLTDLAGETIVMIVSLPVVAWGYLRSRTTVFVGSLALSAGIPMLVFSTAEMLNASDDGNVAVIGSFSLAGGAVLWALGQRRVGAAFVQRAAGCWLVLQGSFMMMGEWRGPGRLVPVAAGLILFWLGSLRLQFESLGAGALAVTVGVSVAIGDWLPSEFTRGLTTIAVGAVMFLAVGSQMRRRKVSPPGPGAPAA
jgi:hypothetical protein